MANINTVAAGLGDRLRTIEGLRVFDYVPDKVAAPMAFVAWEDVQYHRASTNGLNQYGFTITLVIGGRGSERTAQRNLHNYVSDSGDLSIRAAIEGDRTLGGAAQDTVVVSAGDMIPLEVDGSFHLMVDLQVTVYA
jgi:hypothetical protein